MEKVEQLPLADVDTKPRRIPARPDNSDFYVVQAVALDLCKNLRGVIEDMPVFEPLSDEEMEGFDDNSWEKPDNYFGDLLMVLREDTFEWEGYDLGRKLEQDCGWDMDAGIVEVLADASHLRYVKHEEIVRKWVVENELKPKFALNTVVRIKGRDKNAEKEYNGTVVHVYADTLKYTVRVPELGHIEAGAKSGALGTLGFVLEEEKILGLGLQTNVSSL